MINLVVTKEYIITQNLQIFDKKEKKFIKNNLNKVQDLLNLYDPTDNPFRRCETLEDYRRIASYL